MTKKIYSESRRYATADELWSNGNPNYDGSEVPKVDLWLGLDRPQEHEVLVLIKINQNNHIFSF